VDAALHAIADPQRRAILDLIWDRELPSREVAEALEIGPQAASQQLRVLRQAGLVEAREEGRSLVYRARGERLGELRALLDEFWAERLEALAREAEIEQR
jgi:DNA-binding transcriptional ArsR family regulator